MAKEREDRHIISQTITKEGCRFVMITVPNIDVMRMAEYVGFVPVGKIMWDRLQTIKNA